LGPVYQAGTLSGNPLAMAAGLTQLSILEKEKGFDHLEKLGCELEEGVRDVLNSAKIKYTFYRYGSMFCLFFTEKPIRNMSDAMSSDKERFAKFFHSLLEQGVYIAPSQFETGFLSCAHSSADLQITKKAVAEALRKAISV
jgi:glutamate-1-semialdehyde 2,1-aminomutase